MHHRFKWAALAGLVIASSIVPAAKSTPVVGGAATECPAPWVRPPDYPVEAARSGRKGTTLLGVRTDDCGRVQEVRVQQTSGNRYMDAAALEVAPKWVLSANTRAKAVDGWVPMPVDFTFTSDLVSKQVDWPKSHRRPKYVLVGPPEEYSSVAQANEAIRESQDNVVHPPVINVPHRFVQFEGPTGREFWLFVWGPEHDAVYAARFRPVMDGSDPVVQVATLCELKTQSACAAFEGILLRGLPFAKARSQ